MLLRDVDAPNVVHAWFGCECGRSSTYVLELAEWGTYQLECDWCDRTFAWPERTEIQDWAGGVSGWTGTR